jgi:hypothetical protein
MRIISKDSQRSARLGDDFCTYRNFYIRQDNMAPFRVKGISWALVEGCYSALAFETEKCQMTNIVTSAIIGT